MKGVVVKKFLLHLGVLSYTCPFMIFLSIGKYSLNFLLHCFSKLSFTFTFFLSVRSILALITFYFLSILTSNFLYSATFTGTLSIKKIHSHSSFVFIFSIISFIPLIILNLHSILSPSFALCVYLLKFHVGFENSL